MTSQGQVYVFVNKQLSELETTFHGLFLLSFLLVIRFCDLIRVVKVSEVTNAGPPILFACIQHIAAGGCASNGRDSASKLWSTTRLSDFGVEVKENL